MFNGLWNDYDADTNADAETDTINYAGGQDALRVADGDIFNSQWSAAFRADLWLRPGKNTATLTASNIRRTILTAIDAISVGKCLTHVTRGQVAFAPDPGLFDSSLSATGPKLVGECSKIIRVWGLGQRYYRLPDPRA